MSRQQTVKGEPVLTNENGVIVQYIEESRHAHVINASCHCGCELYVSPMIFHDPHEKGNPVVRCADHGVHAYWFKNLELGAQKKENEEIHNQHNQQQEGE